MLAAEATTMTTFLSSLSEGATWVLSQAETIGEKIVNTPVLLIGLVVPILGGAIGIFCRLLKHN